MEWLWHAARVLLARQLKLLALLSLRTYDGQVSRERYSENAIVKAAGVMEWGAGC